MKKVLTVCSALTMLSAMALAEFDLGDLPPCNYPTFFGNPAHTMSHQAWLGPCITSEGEGDPNWGDLDDCDDGVVYVGLPWMPCEMVQVHVTVTLGPNYDGRTLYLNGWKDGNLDGDFCDVLCDGAATEWLVHDAVVTSGTHIFDFRDPGVLDIGTYDAVFRWRLTDEPIGAMGFGFYAPSDCPTMPLCGNFGADSSGEVEDYWLEDQQLDVTLIGFDAAAGDGEVRLTWSTASELGNDQFDVLRNGTSVVTVPSQGSVSAGYFYAWTDHDVTNGDEYTYTLVGVDMNGNREELATESVTPSAGQVVITEYALRQNYPNPFNPSTSITFDLVESGNVSLRVFNMIGQEVATLINGNLASGRHSVSFDAGSLPSGLYLYRLEANGFADQRKMLLIK